MRHMAHKYPIALRKHATVGRILLRQTAKARPLLSLGTCTFPFRNAPGDAYTVILIAKCTSIMNSHILYHAYRPLSRGNPDLLTAHANSAYDGISGKEGTHELLMQRI